MSMSIDIDELSEQELVGLNHRIVARLRFLSQMRAHAQMLDFKIGDIRVRVVELNIALSPTPEATGGRHPYRRCG